MQFCESMSVKAPLLSFVLTQCLTIDIEALSTEETDKQSNVKICPPFVHAVGTCNTMCYADRRYVFVLPTGCNSATLD